MEKSKTRSAYLKARAEEINHKLSNIDKVQEKVFEYSDEMNKASNNQMLKNM